MKLRIPTARFSRDTILVTVGVGGLIFEAYESLSGRADDALIGAFLTMVGTPVVIRRGEANDAKKGKAVSLSEDEV